MCRLPFPSTTCRTAWEYAKTVQWVRKVLASEMYHKKWLSSRWLFRFLYELCNTSRICAYLNENCTPESTLRLRVSAQSADSRDASQEVAVFSLAFRFLYEYSGTPRYGHPWNADVYDNVDSLPGDEANKELWLKRHEYNWICRLGTLNKLGKRGLNKMPYDPIFHSHSSHWGTLVHSASDPRPPLLIKTNIASQVARCYRKGAADNRWFQTRWHSLVYEMLLCEASYYTRSKPKTSCLSLWSTSHIAHPRAIFHPLPPFLPCYVGQCNSLDIKYQAPPSFPLAYKKGGAWIQGYWLYTRMSVMTHFKWTWP